MRTVEATHRVQLVFSLFDADGNGYLEAADFELMGSRVVAAVPTAADARKRALLDAFQRYWTTLVTELDANGDGRVSQEEFTACVLAPERFAPTVDAFAEAFAGLGSLEEDGLVTRPVFGGLMRGVGFQQPNIDALFDALNPTDDDRVAVDIWAEAIRDFYRPEKAGIPGDHLTAGLFR
ncbi:EF-hand domain-containing protein [Streptomyces sp. NPDC059134]|uniref:EF-hand domain-containing protein n=1 Tax=Streptomyces sp. NPDC059134 TaxID=3346738 RepID=UPI0036B9FF84